MKLFVKISIIFSICHSVYVAAAGQAFSQVEFDRLNKVGQPMVVHIHASWCPTCLAQDAILSKLMNSPDFKKVTFLEVDFDHQKNIVKQLHAFTQSTLIVFRNGKEQERSIGDTQAPSIEALIKKETLSQKIQ